MPNEESSDISKLFGSQISSSAWNDGKVVQIIVTLLDYLFIIIVILGSFGQACFVFILICGSKDVKQSRWRNFKLQRLLLCISDIGFIVDVRISCGKQLFLGFRTIIFRIFWRLIQSLNLVTFASVLEHGLDRFVLGVNRLVQLVASFL